MAEQSAVEQPLNPVEQPLKPEEPRPNVDYDPQAIDRRGQYVSIWDVCLACYYFAAGAYTLDRFTGHGSWKLPIIGSLLCLIGMLFFLNVLMHSNKINRWLPFISTYFGRGIFHIIVGVVSVDEENKIFEFLPLVPIATGIAYTIVSCCSRTMVPLPFMRCEKAVEAYKETHPGYEEYLGKYNHHQCVKQREKEYKQNMEKYKTATQAQDSHNASGE